MPQLADTLKQAFAAIENRSVTPVQFLNPSPCKAEPAVVREALPVNQCKMVMGWKTTYPDRYALKMMAMLLGGTPSSKLFANVREKDEPVLLLRRKLQRGKVLHAGGQRH